MDEQGMAHEIDPAIVEVVEMVSNRFGASGLEELIDLAGQHLDRARQALADLDDLGE